MKTYSTYLTDIPRIINNSSPDNLLWGMEAVNDSIRYLVTKYYFNERTYVVPGGTIALQQFYNLPPNVKKLINMTIKVGGVLWQPKECPTRQYWDALNVVQFYQDFPSFFFVYNGQVGVYPTPATTANIMTLNFKTRLVELSQPNYTTGSVSITTNTALVTGLGTTFTKSMVQGGWIKIAHSATDAMNGDNQWYEIDSWGSATTLTLKNNYAGATVAGASYIIGEVPILPEDYQDLPLYRMGIIYYTTRFPDATRAQLYQKLYDDGEARLNDEFGSKTTNVELTDTEAPIINPNLFQRNLT
jgi:hypothetical protein